MAKMKTQIVAILAFCLAVVVCVDAFCKREWDWKRKSAAERAVDADIVIYAGVVESPCLKPKPVVPTDKKEKVPKLANTTMTLDNFSSINENSSSINEKVNLTANLTTALNKINCSAETYNVTLEVFCIIKGGAMPKFIHVDGFGIDEDNCLDEPSMNDTVDEYHAYHLKNYTIFLGRKKDQPDGANAFWLHKINDQHASTEVSDIAKSLMKVAGRHAHGPIGVWENKTHPSCVPYSGASALSFPPHVALTAALVAIFFGLFSSKSF